LANSVGVRLEHDSSYRPPKLSIKDGILAATYGADQVVHLPEAAEAAGRAAA